MSRESLSFSRLVADAWQKSGWHFQANSGTWGFCARITLFLANRTSKEVCECTWKSQKNPRAHKNKIGTSPPPPQTQNPPLKRGILWKKCVFPAERAHFFQASIKLAQPFPAPELRTRILRTRGFFWWKLQTFFSWWTFRIFLFFLLGEGNGSPGRQGGGGIRFLIENPKRGAGVSEEGGGVRGRGWCLRGIWGEGAKQFSFGA